MNTKVSNIQLSELSLDIVYKKIKNVHLSVHPPIGRVTVSAPLWMDPETVRLFCISKMGWIRKQREKLLGQKREAAREYINRESHYFLGEQHLLEVIEWSHARKVEKDHKILRIHTQKWADTIQKEDLLHQWYRKNLLEIVHWLLPKLEEKLNIKVWEIKIRKMRTKWWTCNKEAWRIWLNTELAKKPIEHIEYVLIHEMVHFFERNHNESFMLHMDRYLPQWRYIREQLNRTELGYVDWEY